jgi:hypothetical protein
MLLSWPGGLSGLWESSISRNFEKALLYLVVIDLAAGGNGYLISIASFRLREVLFFVCGAWVAARLTFVDRISIDRIWWFALALFIGTTAFSAWLGYSAGYRQQAILAELKPLAYFPMLMFFIVAIRTRADVSTVVTLLAACGALLAVTYLTILLAMYSGAIGFDAVYMFLRTSDEFIFRHTPQLSHHPYYVGFLYKGAFYICTAALLLACEQSRRPRILGMICAIAVAMTVTRGISLALFAAFVVGAAMAREFGRAIYLGACAAVLLMTLLTAQHVENRLMSSFVKQQEQMLGLREEEPLSKLEAFSENTTRHQGDRNRLKDIQFVFDALDARTLLIGKGLGAPIRGRERVEINYLEIVYKQGLLGCTLWLLIFCYGAILYWQLPREDQKIALAIPLCILFVYVGTASNTFLTGSIGMGAVFISLVSLSVLKRTAFDGSQCHR